MVKSTNDQPLSEQQKEIEKRVKQIMGNAPLDPNKAEEEEKPERLLIIDDKNLPKTTPPPAPPSVQLNKQPKERALAANKSIEQKPKSHKIKRFFRKLWGDPRYRWATIIIGLAALIAVIVTPASRYFLLNSVGIRSRASIVVLDNSTQLPLKNVMVSIAGVNGLTDENGQVELKPLKLGRTQLIIDKRAFATASHNITIGWGSNPLGEYRLEAVGAQYVFNVTDYLSSKPIEKAEAVVGIYSAFSDSSGKIVITIDPADLQEKMTVNISADTYRTDPVEFLSDQAVERSARLVPARKAVYMSKRGGKYNLYTAHIDQKNEKLMLAGTGLERDDMVLVSHPTEEIVALVSSRVNVRNVDGYLLSTLTMVNLTDSSTYQVAQSERIQVVGWIGNRVIFVQIAGGASASDPGRFKLMSYDYKTADKTEIASANSFNDVIVINSGIYYAPSTAYQKSPKGQFIKSTADGKQKTTILDKEVWNIFRAGYDVLNLSVGNDWYEYGLGNSNPIKLNEQPKDNKSKIYISNSSNSNSLWSDIQDKTGKLYLYDTKDKKDTELLSKDGLGYPIRWLNEKSFIFRINTDEETADYAMSVESDKPRKITDVADTSGIDRWYFY